MRTRTLKVRFCIAVLGNAACAGAGWPGAHRAGRALSGLHPIRSVPNSVFVSSAGNSRGGLMRRFLLTLAIFGALALGIVSIAIAASPGTNGQPNQSCEAQPSTPGGGNSGASPGSPFTGGTADSKYAGSQPQNSNNPTS